MQVRLLNKRVKKELGELGVEARASFEHSVHLMQQFGTYALGMPHVRKLHNTFLWEIRMKDRQGIARAIFATVKNDEIVIVHAFRKKTQKTPQQAIALALQRWKELTYEKE